MENVTMVFHKHCSSIWGRTASFCAHKLSFSARRTCSTHSENVPPENCTGSHQGKEEIMCSENTTFCSVVVRMSSHMRSTCGTGLFCMLFPAEVSAIKKIRIIVVIFNILPEMAIKIINPVNTWTDEARDIVLWYHRYALYQLPDGNQTGLPQTRKCQENYSMEHLKKYVFVYD
jgi:hypothetical protein